jgi:hypothetical protein
MSANVIGTEHFSLPFKGKVACDVCDWRAGVGMGEHFSDFGPIPLLASPLKEEEPVTLALIGAGVVH